MIPFQTWLSQVIGYCQFVTDIVGLRRSWVDRDFSQTSVTNFDELYEQLFDDLDSDVIEKNLTEFLEPDQADAISAFLDSIRNVDRSREAKPDLLLPENLLCSDEWNNVMKMAKIVLRGRVTGSESNDSDPIKN